MGETPKTALHRSAQALRAYAPQVACATGICLQSDYFTRQLGRFSTDHNRC
ncbi:MAG: hypothetical protein F6K65_05790 [Moorea sp. SIO3C2]|nr:hypothetical protein [Moorena sp. SIO3C2]